MNLQEKLEKIKVKLIIANILLTYIYVAMIFLNNHTATSGVFIVMQFVCSALMFIFLEMLELSGGMINLVYVSYIIFSLIMLNQLTT